MPNQVPLPQSAEGQSNRSASAHYDRRIELPRVLPLWPQDCADDSIDGRLGVLAKLERALRAERRRGIAGHWTYDLSRHVELLRVYRLEAAALAQAQGRSSMLKISTGGTTRPNAMRMATATTMRASRARSCSALKRSE